MTFYDQDISNAFVQERDENLWNEVTAKASRAVVRLQALYQEKSLPFLHLPSDAKNIEKIKKQAAKLMQVGCKHIVLVGTGGSSFGANALAALTRSKNSLSEPFFHVLDNADPATAKAVYAAIDPKTTVFILVSKSGNTVEVLTHSLMAVSFMRRHIDEAQLQKHFYVITEPKDSPLMQLAKHHNLSLLEHDPNVGGRYSVMSLVGLLPAACVGIDIQRVCAGAAEVMQTTINQTDIEKNPVAIGAALGAYHNARERNVHVFMPYCDHLREFGHWYKQLLSESLGKDGKGITPLTARGAVDQHSMLQLFLDGPDDKFFTLVTGHQKGAGEPLEAEGIDGIEYLNHCTIGDVLEALQQATIDTLAHNHKPLRVIKLHDYTSPEAMGALLMHWMLEVVIIADVMGVNPYDQPAVEQGKKRARSYLAAIR